MSYATPQAMLARYDARIIGDLASDSGQRVSASGLLSDPNLQTALDDASGMIDTAALAADRYTPADLAGLTGTAQAILLRLNCDLAYVLLAARRGKRDAYELPQWKAAQEVLEMLRKGERVFAIQASEDAGIVSSEFPSLASYGWLNLEVDYCAQMFPERRSQQIPSS